jgi:hypothetical protein
MSTSIHRILRTLAAGSLLTACGSEAETPLAPSLDAPVYSVTAASFSWGEPQWLGPVVNSPSRELNPELSPNGRSLYFTSEREGAIEIFVSPRAAPGCAWGPPVKLPAWINSGAANFNPGLSPDGHYIFFARGDHTGQDIYVSHRDDPDDDQGWGPPRLLGPEVNTADNESGPAYLEATRDLYFNRGSPPSTRILVVPMARDGEALGPSREVTELNSPNPTTVNGAVTVRRDGRELIFWSGGAAGPRPGTVGLADLFVSARRSLNDPWSEPVGLGRPLNYEGADLEATLSADGRTLVFSTGRPGGLGLPDLWMSERGPRLASPSPCSR